MSSKYVVFTRGQRHWVTKYLHKDISHCFVLQQDRGKWVASDSSTYGVEIYTIDDHSDILSNSYVIRVEANDRPRPLLMLNTCVGHVKHQLGIRKPFIWTPYQLFKHLRDYHGSKSKKTA